LFHYFVIKDKDYMPQRRPVTPPSDLHPLVEEAQRRGYLSINGDRITYHCHRDYEDDWSDPEEKVRARTYAWLIIERDYSPNRINLEVTVPRRTPNDWADIVLYRDNECHSPYLVVEDKPEGINTNERHQGIEQAFGNANSLRAPYVLFDCGTESILYDLLHFPPGERQHNRLGPRDAIQRNYGEPSQFRLIAGTASDIRPVNANELEYHVRRAHALIWSGGRRDPLLSFDEWSKLLFAKIYDERHTQNDQPRRFQIGIGENPTQVANRIRALFTDACHRDPSIFSNTYISLPDDKIQDVVEVIQDIGFTLADIDALGHAFEHFFGSIFRGDLGQYFTRRELVRFTVSLLQPTDQEFILDPTCGSGGFLLESLMQVWHYIDRNYGGQPDLERRKYDFAHQNVFGIEIHEILGRVCQTNLVLHKDGHTNIEVDRSCLDSVFTNLQLRPDSTVFTIVVGNPPFGDTVESDDTDHLGSNRLDAFEIASGRSQVKSEFAIIERALNFLRPNGRLGMIIPDGLLNNAGENSLCPEFRRYILRTCQILAIVSLPDHAFRKSGAQNKTSILFLKKYEDNTRVIIDRNIEIYADTLRTEHPELSELEIDTQALRLTITDMNYKIFLAEADQIGYNPAGSTIAQNELYHMSNSQTDISDLRTILGQYFLFTTDPSVYVGALQPQCMSIDIKELFESHSSFRLDPKFHLFKRERMQIAPANMKSWRLNELLTRREERIIPTDYPDREFKVLTLTQEGQLEEREAGKGNNPPAWFGQYFSDGSRWFVAHAGDLIFSQIDIWKGCVAIIPDEFDGAIVTQEFPLYRVNTAHLDPYYLRLLLRSYYFQRAIRAITTGHSNRRRTQQEDFESLEIYLPDIDVQKEIGRIVRNLEQSTNIAAIEFQKVLDEINECIIGQLNTQDFIKNHII
jgi:type I restriction enzyme M protein